MKYWTYDVFTEALLNVLKTGFRYIVPGKIQRFNAVQEGFVDFLKSQNTLGGVLCIPQVNNLEDELVRSCNIKNICELTHSKSKKKFKTDFANCTNMKARLKECEFSMKTFWSRIPQNAGFKQAYQKARRKLSDPDGFSVPFSKREISPRIVSSVSACVEGTKELSSFTASTMRTISARAAGRSK